MIKKTKLLLFLFLFSVFAESADLDSLIKVAESVSGEKKTNLYLKIADMYKNVDFYQGKEYCEKAYLYSKNNGLKKEEVKSLLSWGMFFAITGNIDSAKIVFTEAKNSSEKLNSDSLLARSYLSLGNLDYMTGNQIGALANYESALIFYSTLKDTSNLITIYNNLGVVYGTMGLYEKSVAEYIKSLNLSRSLKNPKQEFTALLNIGTVYYDLQNFNQALIHFTSALKLVESTGNQNDKALALLNLGLCYSGLKNYSDAKTSFEKSLEIARKIKLVTVEISGLINLADLNSETGDFQSAYNYAKEALNLSPVESFRENRIVVLNILSKILIKNGSLAEAYGYITEAITLSDDFGLKLKLESTKILADYYLRLGDLKNYAGTINQQIILQDSMYNESLNSKVAELEVQFNLESKTDKINLLTAEKEKSEFRLKNEALIRYLLIAGLILFALVIVFLFHLTKQKTQTQAALSEQHEQIKAQARELESLNTAKDKFFSILAHDLKSPLNAVIGYADVLADESDIKTPEEQHEFAQGVKSAAYSLNDMLTNLLHWSRLQLGNLNYNPGSVDLNELVSATEKMYGENFKLKKLKFTAQCEIGLSAFADKNMLSITVNNLISNAIKFTPEGGSISLKAFKENQLAMIQISDTGIGMSEEKIKSLFDMAKFEHSTGTSGEMGSGLGLKICRDMIQLNRGTIEILSKTGEGTVIKVTFPVSIS